MFSRNPDKTQKKTSTSSSVIGTEMQINGNIKCSGKLVLKGIVKGNIECEHVHISAEGNQKGNIKAFECIIGGNFEGDVTAESLAIEPAANIKGNMYYNSLSARPGANLEIQLFRGLDKRIEDKSLEKEKRKKQSRKSKGV
tara:strand:- start:105 stop:527 length:423 start_codon:yes stop_codon:yes gene_type:complete